MRKIIVFFVIVLSFLSIKSQTQTEARLLRFPNIRGNQVVFTYAGDLYTVNIKGGIARRLTSDPGFEMFAKISPDGKYIAFTAQYDGNTEVYIMPSEGGIPKRLTYTATLDRDDVADRMGPNNIVMGWTPDSKNIIYRSRCFSYNSFRGLLFTVDINGDMPKEVPVQDGGFCSYSPDGKYLAFNNIFREFRTWKYYRGGMADDIWVYDFASKKAVKLFDNPAQDIFPMWTSADKIYFASDRDRIMNIFSYDLNDDKISKVTHFKKYDVKFPSMGTDKIIFENAGYLYYLTTSNDSIHKMTIYINNDFSSTRNKIVDASKRIQSVDLSPKGDFLLFSARGEIFRVPSIKGVTKDYSNTPGVHERNAVWSPDGKYIAFISDKSGEFELYYQKADGSEPAIKLTSKAQTYKFKIKWSPDSKKLVWNDELLRLRYINITNKKITEIDKSNYFAISSFNWSPDSRWITYSLPNFKHNNKIMIFDTKDASKHEITTGWFSSSSPSFSFDGKYLVFVSSRSFDPTYGDLDWNVVYNNMQKIYLVLLSNKTANPFATQESYIPKENDTLSEISSSKVVSIDFNNIRNRIISLPIRPAYYWNVYSLNNKIYYDGQTEADKTSTLYMYDLNKQKETVLGKGINFHIPWNGKKMLISKDKKYAVIDLPNSPIDFSSVKYADLSSMKYKTDYQKEYKQIFDESWRQMRDFFYDPNMRGLNWDSIYKKYSVFLPYIHHRDDLTYIIGEMIGELSTGHAYVGGGERPKITKIYTGLLGARFSKDPGSGYFKIDKILKGASWSKSKNSPLQVPGLKVKTGDFIIAINGVETKTVRNIYQLLVNTAGKPTELTVNSKASKNGARKIVVIPLKSEANLYYYQWVEKNLAYVSKKTNNQVGYVHIPDMMTEGMNEFVNYFYAQIRKKALIVDDRGNGGGNVSPMIIERLRRKMVMQQMWRNVPMAGPVPDKTLVGPKVLLLNQYSASDGDLFAYQFKTYKIGTLIGKRSWGGVTGIDAPIPMIDGGVLYKPEYGHYSADGKKWIIEGHGVDPDIEVENNPAEAFRGKDSQLDKAIEVILEQMKNFPDKVVPNPPFPDKKK